MFCSAPTAQLAGGVQGCCISPAILDKFLLGFPAGPDFPVFQKARIGEQPLFRRYRC